MRILLIDDSELALATMRTVLGASGHCLFSASSAIGVSSIIFREGIEVVVLDVELGSFRGDRLVALFRKQRRLAKLGVVLVSAQSEAEVESLRAESGADAAVSKAAIGRLPRAIKQAYCARQMTAP